LGNYLIGPPAVVNVQTFSTNFSPDLYVTGSIPDVTPRPVARLAGRQRSTIECAQHTIVANKWCAMHTLLVFAYVSADVANRLPEALLVFHKSDAHIIFAALAERSARSD